MQALYSNLKGTWDKFGNAFNKLGDIWNLGNGILNKDDAKKILDENKGYIAQALKAVK